MPSKSAAMLPAWKAATKASKSSPVTNPLQSKSARQIVRAAEVVVALPVPQPLVMTQLYDATSAAPAPTPRCQAAAWS